MNKYQMCLEWIASGAANFVVAMYAIIYFLIQAEGMDAEHLADIMTRIGMSFNTSTYVLNVGEANYTINDLIALVISTDEYCKNNDNISPEFVKYSIYIAFAKGHITSEQKMTLRAALANA